MLTYFTYEDILSNDAINYIQENIKHVPDKILQTIITMLCYNIINDLTNNIKFTADGKTIVYGETGYDIIVKHVKRLYNYDGFDMLCCDKLDNGGFVINSKLLYKLNACDLLGVPCSIRALNIKNQVVFEVIAIK